MSAVLESDTVRAAVAQRFGSSQRLPASQRTVVTDDPTWITATIRPVGSFGRDDTSRLRALLDALAACASIVVLDLQAARLRSSRAAEVIEDAAWDLERRGGCLMCVNVDDEARACLVSVGDHAILMGAVPDGVGRD
jgi:hypothetical protein